MANYLDDDKKSATVNGYRISSRDGKWQIVKNSKVVHVAPNKNAAYVWAAAN